MKVLVTGGTGFLGRRLISALLQQGVVTTSGDREVEIDELVVADIAEPPAPLPPDPRLKVIYGDFTEPNAAANLVDADTAAVFHLAAVVSGEAEQNFDIGMRVNVHGTMQLLEACRAAGTCPRVVFASSCAVYGGDIPEVIEDGTIVSPQTSYGSQKAIGEHLIQDFSRKGFIDGRALRLPTIVVRPGRPNAAASSFASSVLREPLQGAEVTCPVSDSTRVWVLSPRRVTECFLHAQRLPARDWGMSRCLPLPGLSVTVRQMCDSLADVAGETVAARVHFEPDPFIEKIVYGWPGRFTPRRAQSLGFRGDRHIREIIEAFVEDDLGGEFVS